MPNKNLIYLLLFFLVFINSCHKGNKKIIETAPKLYFDVSKWNKNQNIPSDIIKEIAFIPLETSKDILIGEIDKIIVYNENYYIADSKYRKDILVFDNKGHFINKIGKHGRGAGEYTSLTDFIIDKKNNLLIILDGQVHKLLFYDIVTGLLKMEFKLDYWVSNIALISENNLALYSKEQIDQTSHSIAVLNLKNKEYKWFLKQDKFDTNLSAKFSIFQSENIYFCPYFKDVVYQITEHEAKPFALFNYGDSKIPIDQLDKDDDGWGLVELMKNGDWSCSIQNFYENSDFITFNFNLKGSNTLVIFSKSTDNFFYGGRYESPLESLTFLHHNAVNNEAFISTINASSLLNMKDKILKSRDIELTSDYQRVIADLSINSNPVLVTIKYKKF